MGEMRTLRDPTEPDLGAHCRGDRPTLAGPTEPDLGAECGEDNPTFVSPRLAKERSLLSVV